MSLFRSTPMRTLRTCIPMMMLTAALAGCGKDDPQPPPTTDPDLDTRGECKPPPVYTEEVKACMPLSTDYRPREPAVNNSAGDAWPACISDDNTYHRVQESISTIARVAAFEQMAGKLWAPGRVPTNQDFLDAATIFEQSEGLSSRVVRREDIHYPAPANGAKCSDPGVPEQYPDRCVGPTKLLPVIVDALEQGYKEEDRAQRRVHAARIEAALLWFLYVSPLSEVTSCASKPQDCDSAWAYYTGGTERSAPVGLARYVRALGPETHERTYDALLGVRCWRNLDNETGAATNLAMRDRIRTQLDRSLLRGMALIVRQRFSELTCTSGDVKEARWAFLQVMVPLLDRAARERDAAKADVLRAQVAKAGPDEVDVPAALAALDSLFGCP